MTTAAASDADLSVVGGSEFKAVENALVVPCAAGVDAAVPIVSLWDPNAPGKHVLVFLSHFGDLTSWELGQKIRDKMGAITASGATISVIGLGSAENAQAFARLLDFPSDVLFATSDLNLYKDGLGFAPGFLPEASNVSPYVKLLGMLAGIGSPGTIAEVLRGYVGDRDAPQIFGEGESLFDIVGYSSGKFRLNMRII